MAGKRRAETMEENRIKLIGAARKAFAASGFAAASMDDLTAAVGLTRGARGNVHGGLFSLFRCAQEQVGAAVRRFRDRRQTVRLTGHSRGGALAVLAASRLRSRRSRWTSRSSGRTSTS